MAFPSRQTGPGLPPSAATGDEVARLKRLVPAWLAQMEASDLKITISDTVKGTDLLGAAIASGWLYLNPDDTASMTDHQLLAMIAHEAHHHQLERAGLDFPDEAPGWVWHYHRAVAAAAIVMLPLPIIWTPLDTWVHGPLRWAVSLCMYPIMLALLGIIATQVHRFRSPGAHAEEFACDKYAAQMAGSLATIQYLNVLARTEGFGFRIVSHLVEYPTHPSPRRRISRLRKLNIRQGQMA